ncbi:vacuolar protein sorting-associated protein 13 [Irpex rosettiformis]|uniref:Vacuolar protein sorting-associated protein 13 n=1 Tax=Irpex rosettiformis TaxID=378272 RepID=A0ACB8UKG7_9APHY|nr:vacuolar protein sorting-associated protein 13 [Irpex rosettiformis]
MWWLDPGKEVLNVLFNRVLAPYVENLDLNQVNYGIGQGQLTLHKLRLKRGALDKFRLPVDVIEGHLGKFSLSLHWMNLGNQPVEVLIEDVYLLVVPSSENTYDAEEEERRAQAAKAERLENAELLHLQGQAEQGQSTPQQQGLISSLMTKVINNLQVTVKNIHIRYEDKLSVPGHPFSTGITLAGFTAASVNDQWLPAFIDSTASVIHKLAQLESLAVYFDTDATSLAGLSHQEFIEKFTELIAHGKQLPRHQFILKPVSGQGRVKMNKTSDKDTPRFDIQLLFDEIGVLLDDNQYRDAISLVDMYHFYIRQHQYHKYRPALEEFKENRPKALWKFARAAILEEVRDRHRRWTWSYFAERRDDRRHYVELFKSKQLGPLSPQDLGLFDALEKKLSYEDLRFYRSIARSQLKKDLAARKKIEDEKKSQQTQNRGSWSSWLWGPSDSSSTSQTPLSDPAFSGDMTDEQRKELYEVLDYDEKSALAASFETPRDALRMRIVAKLDRGSFALKTDPHGKNVEIVSIVVDRFQTTFIQRPDNFETSLSLTGFAVHDGTTTDTLYPRIVYVQDEKVDAVSPPDKSSLDISENEDPFFFLRFENNPLDDRADSALTVKMRNMEIVYHRGYVEAIYHFFKPPVGQMESVEALLDVAGQTLEGIRSQTRAGLEYALQTHKTIDVHMDLAAPIIIIPENITSQACRHLILDAGHISIESELANKKAVQEINAKRKQQYSEEDYKRLESLMYDKLTVKLDSTQLLVGDNLDSLRAALTSSEHDDLHLIERVNIDFLVQNSIVPTAYNLARFKISGQLPTLQLNFSDTKYKSIMRLIDVTIPQFDSDNVEPTRPSKATTSAFRLPSGYFGATEKEYGIEDEDEDTTHENVYLPPSDSDADVFFEAPQGDEVETPEIKQHTVEFSFRVDTLRATLFKSKDSKDRELGNVSFADFSLLFVMAKYTMAADVDLKSVNMDIIRSGDEPAQLLSSASSGSSEGLLAVRYRRVQPESPVFLTVYNAINQNVDIKIAAVAVNAAPEPLIGLYDFIMTTFIPESGQSPPTSPPTPEEVSLETDEVTAATLTDESRINVVLKFAGVRANLFNGAIQIATLSFPTADVTVLLYASTMRIEGSLGSLSITDDSTLVTAESKFKELLSIEGENLVTFRYQTFNPGDKQTYTGIKSSVYLAAGSVRVHYLEEPLHELFVFLTQLAKLKGLYDAATEAAVQSVSDIDRMKYEISIQSPVIIFPSAPEHSRDALTLRLGEFSANNSYEGSLNKIKAALRGIRLSSTLVYDGKSAVLKMIDDIDASAEITQASDIDRSQDSERPDTQVSVGISDIKLHLTEVQYCLLIQLLQSIARVLPSSEETGAIPLQNSSAALEKVSRSPPGTVDLQPEFHRDSDFHDKKVWSTLDAVITLETVKLHLYDHSANSEDTLKEHGIARFALNSFTLRAKALSDGATEAELVLKSFTMSNTRPGNSKFREIIPAAQHTRNQVMILYSTSAGADLSSMAVVTVDSPQVIFAVEPVIGLLEFFTSAFDQGAEEDAQDIQKQEQSNESTVSSSTSKFNLRLDLHDLSVSILEDDAKLDSRAIQLCIKIISLSYQETLALSVERLGMSLTRMGKDAETVRFLDDIDFTFSLDSRSSGAHQQTSIELNSQPVVFRASYRDINLITTIASKAIELYSSSTAKASGEQLTADASTSTRVQRPQTSRRLTRRSGSRVQTIGNANVIVTKEEFKCSCDGFRLVLIGDLHEQPMLHLRVKPFILGAKDWSGELRATTTMAVHLSYWNLTNSHWEPLIDPWAFTVSVSKDGASGGLLGELSSKERLDLNITTTFIELALATYNVLGKEPEQVLGKARGSYAPYRIHNRTGLPVHIWSDVDGSANMVDSAMTELLHDKSIDWRFDDWRTVREHVSSTGHNSIGLQFIGKQWEQVRSIPVDKEGEYTFSLRPRTGKYAHRVLCEVVVHDNVKVVTLRSTYKVENRTLYPVELVMVNESGQPVGSPEKIAPGQDYALPIEGFGQNRIKIQPDQGFGYKWSPAIRWEDLVTRREFTIRCPHADSREAVFRFQTYTDTDSSDLNVKKYPKLNLKLRAPVELENLLPYNIEYRIYDKDADQNWRSYLRKGGVMPVHSVELSHMVLLNVYVQDTVFKPSDFAIINTDGTADFDIENRLILRDNKDRKLDLRLNYIRYPNSGGCFKVQIYCPYLIINKTGLPFSVRPWRANRIGTAQDIAGDTRPVLSHPNAQGRDFSFKIGDSMWSERVGFEAPAAESRLLIPSQSNTNEEVHVGLSWSEGSGKYKLTKVITLSPRFILRNNSNDALVFREHGSKPRGHAILQPGERTPLHFLRMGDNKMLTLAFSDSSAQWSPPLNVEDIGAVHFHLRNPRSNQTRLLRADIKLGGSTIFIVISNADSYPFVIENESDFGFTIYQSDADHPDGPAINRSVPTYEVKQKSTIDYVWDHPASREKKLILNMSGARRAVDIMEIGDLIPFRFSGGQGPRIVSLDVRAESHQQVLRITNYNPQLSLYKPTRRNTAASIAQSDSSGSQEAFEAVQEESSFTFALHIDFEGFGLSLMNHKTVEVVYLTASHLKFEYTASPVAQAVNISCGNLQIDNQLHDALFPVVLQPTPISKDSSTMASLPTVQGSLIWLKDEAHGVTFVKYCSILLQALTIQADEDFLFALFDLTKIKGAPWDATVEDVLIQQPEEIPEPDGSTDAGDLYFEVLELQPIKLSLSFMRTERVSSEEQLSIRNPFAVVVNAITMAVGNVSEAPLEMNALAIKDMRLTLPDLQGRITYHYSQEVLRQLYRILGSAELIGNPVGLFTNVSSGVADIFYEPFNGAVMHGNQELGIGIAKGAASFVKKTVFGFSDSFTKITSSVGKGLSAATFDSDYQMQRRMTQRRNRPRHAIYGVTAGMDALANSVASGVEGVLMKPLEGAESDGARGFFKGIGKGLVGEGMHLKYVVNHTLMIGLGIRNTTTVFDSPARERVRLPYSERGALGQYWMRDLDKGAYRKELYVAHLNLPGGDNVVLLTTNRVISFWSNKLGIEWQIPFTHVQGVTIEDTGIRFAHKGGKEHDRFVYIPSKSSQTWFFGQVASVVKAFNARRRIDS